MIEILGIQFNIKSAEKPDKREIGMIEAVKQIREAIEALESGFYTEEETSVSKPLEPLYENMYRTIIFQYLPNSISIIKLRNGKPYTNPFMSRRQLNQTKPWDIRDINAFFKRKFPKHWNNL